MHYNPSPWSKEETDALRKIHAEGHIFAVIAQKLNDIFHTNRSRASTIARSRRIGLSRVRVVADKEKPEVYYHMPKVKPPELAWYPNLDTDITINELTSKTCRWPYGVEKITYCGATVFRRDYCQFCFEIAYKKVSTKV